MNFKIFIIGVLALLAVSCSHISEDERLIYVKPAQAARCILIEDFTGQRCVNCPAATAEISKLQQQYHHCRRHPFRTTRLCRQCYEHRPDDRNGQRIL